MGFSDLSAMAGSSSSATLPDNEAKPAGVSGLDLWHSTQTASGNKPRRAIASFLVRRMALTLLR